MGGVLFRRRVIFLIAPSRLVSIETFVSESQGNACFENLLFNSFFNLSFSSQCIGDKWWTCSKSAWSEQLQSRIPFCKIKQMFNPENNSHNYIKPPLWKQGVQREQYLKLLKFFWFSFTKKIYIIYVF